MNPFTDRMMMSLVILPLFLMGGSAIADPLPGASPLPPPPQSEVRTDPNTGTRTLWVESNGQMAQVGELTVLPKGTEVFHWADEATIDRWLKQGHIDPAELSFMIQGSGAAGGGFYASVDSWDSSGYGPKGISVFLPKDQLMLSQPQPLVSYPILDQVIKAHGIEGYTHYNNQTWNNFLNPEVVSHVQAPSPKEILDHASALKTTWNQTIVQMLLKVPGLKDDPEFKAQYPVLFNIIHGYPVAPADRQNLWNLGVKDALENNYLMWSTPSDPAGPPLVDFKKLFHKEMVADYQGMAQQFLVNGTLTPGSGDQLEQVISLAASNEVSLSELMPGQEAVRPVLASASNLSPYLPPSNDPFFSNLQEAFYKIRRQDFLPAMANNNPTPWTLYDIPGGKTFDLLRQAGIQVLWGQNVNPADVYRAMVDNPSVDFRATPLKSSFYPVTAHQLDTLQKNPYLVVESREVTLPGGAKQLQASQEYPSARTYKKFASMLSTDLQNQLQAADTAKKFADTQSPEFKSLTQDILKELSTPLIQTSPQGKSLSSSERLYSLVAVRPFPEGDHGTTLRLLAGVNYTYFAPEADEDLVKLTLPEVLSAETAGTQDLSGLMQGFQREATVHHQMPHYYDTPELWQLIANQPGPIQNPDQFVAAMRQRLNSGNLKLGCESYFNLLAQ
jgi:hypothetical protein